VVAPFRVKATMLTDQEDLMAKPTVVHCKRAEYDVYIGRPSRWGNPFQIGRDGSDSQATPSPSPSRRSGSFSGPPWRMK